MSVRFESAGRALDRVDEICAGLSESDHPDRQSVLAEVLSTMVAVQSGSLLSSRREAALRMVRAAPVEVVDLVRQATQGCSGSCAVRQFWLRVVADVVGADVVFGRLASRR